MEQWQYQLRKKNYGNIIIKVVTKRFHLNIMINVKGNFKQKIIKVNIYGGRTESLFYK